MKIGIMSDTHDRVQTMLAACQLFSKAGVTVVVHGGDWTQPETLRALAEHQALQATQILGVIGNRDDRTALLGKNDTLRHPVLFGSDPEFLVHQVFGYRIGITHGHLPKLVEKLAAHDLDLVCTGHTHRPQLERRDKTWHINPGSTAFTIPRSRAPKTVAFLDTERDEAKLLEVL